MRFFLSLLLLYSLVGIAAAADSTVLTKPVTNAVKLQGYVLSTGAYRTRCHWAKANTRGTNKGDANCKDQPISAAVCMPGYRAIVSTAVSSTEGYDNIGYEAIKVDANPVLREQGSPPYYTLSYFNFTTNQYLDALALWHGSDDAYLTIRYSVFCSLIP